MRAFPVPGGYYAFFWEDWAYSGFSGVSMHNGDATYHWTIGIDPSSGLTPFGLAFDLDGTIFTTLNYLSFVPEECYSLLARVNPQTGETTVIGEPIPQNTSGPEIDACGNVYVLGFDVPPLGYIHGDRYLYRVDKYTGVPTQIGYTGDHHEWMDMAFDSEGRLWGTYGNKLYIIDTQTGAATFITNIYGVPDAEPPRLMEVMSTGFDEHDVLYGMGLTVHYDHPQGSPVMRIDTASGVATLLGYSNTTWAGHGGDTYPTQVRIAHRQSDGGYTCVTVSMSALAAHLAHGDYVPGTMGHDCNCP